MDRLHNQDDNNKQQAQQFDTQPDLPPGWRLDMKLGADASGELGGVAELWEDEQLRCRLVLTRYGQDRAAAVARVNSRVEYWLSEWLARPHTGGTAFGELE
jgi:hypothetical protein